VTLTRNIRAPWRLSE